MFGILIEMNHADERSVKPYKAIGPTSFSFQSAFLTLGFGADSTLDEHAVAFPAPPWTRVIVCTMIRRELAPRLFHGTKLGFRPLPKSTRVEWREIERKRHSEKHAAKRNTRVSNLSAPCVHREDECVGVYTRTNTAYRIFDRSLRRAGAPRTNHSRWVCTVMKVCGLKSTWRLRDERNVIERVKLNVGGWVGFFGRRHVGAF